MEENEKPNYYAIIPANVRYDKDLRASAKLLYGEITSLCNEKGICWASNEYFARLYKTTKETVSRWISQLKDKKYINVTMFYKKNSKEVDKRIITICNNYPIDENVNTPIQKSQDIAIDENVNTPIQKSQTPIDEKVKENNKNIILNINNNIYSRVIEYLNQKTSKNFKSSTKKTQTFIQARLNEGFEYKDFVTVIDTKTKEWKNDKQMNKYLRPETLFGTKFEGYLNETATEQKQEEKEDDVLEEYKELRKRFGGEPR